MKKNDNKTIQNIDEQKRAEAMDTAENQVAIHLIALLDQQAQRVNQNVADRLATARNYVVTALTERESALVNSQTIMQSDNTLQWSSSNLGHYFRQHRVMMMGLIVMAVLVAFFAAQQLNFNNIERSDAFLLASDLPPEAYADQGFDAWLDTTN